MAEATPEADMSKYVPLSSPYSPICGLVAYSSTDSKLCLVVPSVTLRRLLLKFSILCCFLLSQAKGFGFGIKTTEALSLIQVDRFIGPSQAFWVQVKFSDASQHNKGCSWRQGVLLSGGDD